MGFVIAVDTGGTFTDLVAYDRDSSRVLFTKSLTNYRDFVAAVMACIEKSGVDLKSTDLVKLGTTLVINTFIQRSGAKLALVTTRGYRDVLELRRGSRPVPLDLRFAYDPVLVPRRLRFEVSERMTAEGEVFHSLDEAELEELARRFASEGIGALAISFLNAYVNPAHEQMAAAFFRRRLPGVYVSAGTELSREWYEYERTSTAAANAYVGPRLQEYVRRLDERLRADGFDKRFYLMGSNGGVFSVERAAQQPVMLVESGPVGGCIGAGVYARALDLDKVIAFDMGGTTAKCALVTGGNYEVKSPYYVGGSLHGFPVRGAVVDIVEVGAGGGSIAALDEAGRLTVGPRSAGSDPGPVCYGRGGLEPTITDANLVLGRIGANAFLGGEFALDAPAAAAAIERRIVEPLRLDGTDRIDMAAQGIIDLGTTIMANAIKQITIERGYDPREFSLLVFGGGGPLHGVALAHELNIPRVIVPAEPGEFAALGMLMADIRVDTAETFLHDLDDDAVARLHAAFARMEAATVQSLAGETLATGLHFERQVEMRFKGQRQYMRATLGDARTATALRARFESAYHDRYGHVDAGAPLEIVNLVSIATAATSHPDLRHFRSEAASAPAEPDHREVFFPGAGKRLRVPVYRRAALAPGFACSGPAVVEEYGSTTIVPPGDRLSVGAFGELTIDIGNG